MISRFPKIEPNQGKFLGLFLILVLGIGSFFLDYAAPEDLAIDIGNPEIHIVTFYKEGTRLHRTFSVDINNYVSYDSLTLDSLKMALRVYPTSIYK